MICADHKLVENNIETRMPASKRQELSMEPESLYRSLRQLQEEGLIQRDQRRIKLLNPSPTGVIDAG